jgi:DEAD/DEAH box helicase domain-containing protein
MEFVQKVTFREMNFGKRDNGGETIMIAGKEIPKNGFAVCLGCGKVQNGKKPSHTLTCSKKDSDPAKNILDFLYLYREFTSQALRILLPMQPLAWSDRKLHSFTAALYLGLKRKFEGNIDHLRTTIHEEPSPDHQYRKRYLVLYDMVPGGTGYLKELMANEQSLMDVFQMALDLLKACPCNQDPEKDGCYRCLYAYRNNYERNDTSRDTAIELLSDILKYRNQVVKTSSLKNLSINPLLDSALEEKFIEALRSFSAPEIKIMLRQEIVNGKPGWYLKVNDRGYFIAPQVELGAADGVLAFSRADFIFYPERSSGGLPLVLFTDGFMYHAGRIGKDMAQRMAIARSGKFTVWSLSWDDVENSLNKKGGHYENFLGDRTEKINGLNESYDQQFQVKKLGGLRYQSSFDMFMTYLADPLPKMWKMSALIHALVHLDCVGQADDALLAAQALWQDMPWQDIQVETKPDSSGSCLSGLYQKSCDESPLIKLLARLDREDYLKNRFHKLSVICRFFDDGDLAVNNPRFKAAWNGFIRMYNIYQFIPEAVFITSKGISEGHYSWLITEEGQEEEKAPGDSAAWAELRKVTDVGIHPLLSFLSSRGLPLPEAGFELCNEGNEIIATGELCWPEKKIALLRDDEIVGKSCFIERGWQTMPLADIISDPSQAVSLFK